MKMTLRNFTLAAFLLPALSSCAVTIQPPTTYALNEVPAVHQSYRSGKIIMVMIPDANPYYRTTEMAYEIKPHQVSYFTRNAWAEPPAKMLQPLVVKTLQNTHHYRAVVSPPVTGNYDYMLTTQILVLRANLDNRAAVYEVTIRAQMFNAHSNRAVATKDITVYEPIIGCTFYNKVQAANRAVAKVLAQIARFSVRTTG